MRLSTLNPRLSTLSLLLLLPGCSRAAGVRPETRRADLLNYRLPLATLFPAEAMDREGTTLKIEKAAGRLIVLHRGKPLKSYPVVFGRNPKGNKQREGDGRTPEGLYKIDAHYHHRQWSRFLRIDYPNADSWRRFRANRAAGRIRPRDTIGGFIGIHGVPEGQDSLIENRTNWTLGCISLKNADVEELYDAVRIGTRVEIVP